VKGGAGSLESKKEVQKSVARSGVCGAGAVVLLHFLLKNLDESGASEKNLIVSCCAFSQGGLLFA